MERWKKIPGYPSHEVSNKGRVRSLDRTIEMKTRWGGTRDHPVRGRVLKLQSHDGYHRVQLRRGKLFRIHRLVLLAFVGPCPPGNEVRHLDGNGLNNEIENLAYGTREENQADRVLHGTSNRGERSGSSRLTESDVHEIRASPLRTGLLAKRFGVSRDAIQDVRSGHTWGWLSSPS